MERPHDIAQQINDLLIRAADSISEFNPDFDPQIRTADERFGDFQANGILPFAKKNNLNPRELGEKLIASLPPSEDWEISLAGPGFINFKLSKEFLAQWLKTFSNKAEIKKAMTAREPSKITLDFSSPNTAKQMHVGHIRSTIIGESLARLMKLVGHEVIKDNHLGDWGTQFGILLYAIKREKVDLNQLGTEPIARLEELYRSGNQWTKEDENALSCARDELVKLQGGNEENLSLWQKIRDLSMQSFDQVYELLGVSFDHAHGESFYRDQVDQIYLSLGEHKICREDDGALVVFHPEHKRFSKQPFIIRKSDGASNYATTDLATLSYRVNEWKSDRIIYVTDGRQRDHFEQLFLTAEKWFDAEKRAIPKLSHVWFGTILGEDNKAIKTRDGEPIKLIDLLNEAIRRASEMVKEKIPSWNRKKFKEELVLLESERLNMPTSHRTGPWTMFSPGKKCSQCREIPPLTYNMRLPEFTVFFEKSMVYRRIESKKPAHRKPKRSENWPGNFSFSIGDRTGSPGAETTLSLHLSF